MRARGSGWSTSETFLALNAHLTHNVFRAQVAMGAKKRSDVPDPLKIPEPNAAKRKALTHDDLVQPFLSVGKVQVTRG